MSILPSPSDHAEMPKRIVGRRLVRTCSCGKPWPCDQSAALLLAAAWADLRAEVKSHRDSQHELAGDHEESGHDWQTERAYGRVEALDWMMAAIDRIAPAQSPETAAQAEKE